MGFRTHVIIRLVAIFLLGYSAIYILVNTPFWLLALWVILGTIIMIISMIRYLERNRRDMTNFLLSIQQNDFTTTFPKGNTKIENDWQHAFDIITSKFKELRSEKQSNYHFLQAIVEHTGVPLICFSTDDKMITLMNEAAKDLFQKPFLNSVDSLKGIDSTLPQLLLQLKSGEKELHTIKINNQAVPLSILAKELILETKKSKLIAFHNIKNELEEKELESWQKLIKVLTHEIKNSAIPISTLASVINQMIIDDNGDLKDIHHFDHEAIEDLKNGLQTVEKRSKGLVNFVSAYSQLSKLPEPNLQEVSINELFKNVRNLLSNSLQKNEIALHVESAEDMIINADKELIEQVLINLVKNAIEALHEVNSPKIELRAYQSDYKTAIQVFDNGLGIDSESLENIFVPFYTTKKEGSGIGLSLSRQIMRSHGGSMYVRSENGLGTTFYLEF